MKKSINPTWLKKYFFILVYFFCVLQIGATTPSLGMLNFATPNAASFQKFIDNPIGLYNGTPEVSIPIYTLKDGMIELPITLRYNTSGVKVAEDASWVGLGWNLNVGGVISKRIVGVDDDRSSLETYQYLEPDNNFLYYTDLNGGSSSVGFTAFKQLCNVFGSETGIQPDIYYISIPEFSGKFVVDNGNAYLLKKEKDIKIEFTKSGAAITAQDGTYIPIKVTTNEGIIYYFQELPASLIIGEGAISQDFVLKETHYPNGQIATYYYNYGVSSFWPKSENNVVSLSNILRAPGNQLDVLNRGIDSHSLNISTLKLVEHYLTKIETTNFSINFKTDNPASGQRKLQEIRIDTIKHTTSLTPPLKMICFFSSFFESFYDANLTNP